LPADVNRFAIRTPGCDPPLGRERQGCCAWMPGGGGRIRRLHRVEGSPIKVIVRLRKVCRASHFSAAGLARGRAHQDRVHRAREADAANSEPERRPKIGGQSNRRGPNCASNALRTLSTKVSYASTLTRLVCEQFDLTYTVRTARPGNFQSRAMASIGELRMKHSTRSMIGMTFFLAVAPLTSWAAPLSSGCGAVGLSSGTYTMQHGGITRTFRVHVPTGYDKNTPARLVTIFHGWGGNENEFLSNKTVTSLANSRGYILVAPRGLGSGSPDSRNNSWSFSGSTTGLDGDGVNSAVPGDTTAICNASMTPDYSYPSCASVKKNTCSWTQCQADDVAFVVALVDLVESKLCVDANNVFATGGSNGGMFTWELGQNPQSATTFRAIAPLIGLPHRGYLRAQGKVVGMPALVVTGTTDNVVPPGAWDNPSYTTTSNGNDRYFYTGATAITRSWAQAQGCNVSGNAVSFDDGSSKTDCRTYCSADAGWPRVLDCRAKMGHSYSLSWSWKLILDFFDKHTG